MKKLYKDYQLVKSVYDLSDQYLTKYRDPYIAADKLKINQIAKCGTSGFITGLGGVITLPIAIPANISSVIYIQLRMIACIAYIGGYDPSDDEVQTLAYVCLTGSAAADILKKAGINISEKITVNMIKKIPGAVLTKINQKVGFRFLTKFGEKGVINFVKLVPLVGGVIGGGVDIARTKVIADKAIKIFIEGKIQ
ncbi:EcsC family protein [Anaerocolumna sp. AGMB13020]|uniref:EcsC family protein n=1 Tax=Anaerocolumna sp. AGMB13020 TaxID=3081750 RepID=UPI0029552575|nr:EcsC family protein [Anaerocolumna sp. AGMB13020]WOO36008.1 EcsC family protein [Anaerocolumna sp. AGMB13020]